MKEAFITGIGMAAALLSVVSLLPQVIRTCRTRSANDISAGWLLIALLSMAMWIGYGGLTGAYPVLWANLITAVQASVILAVKWTPRDSMKPPG